MRVHCLVQKIKYILKQKNGAIMNSLKKKNKKMNPPGGSIALSRRKEQPRLDSKAWVLRLWVRFFFPSLFV